ncbi:asparagine synthase-related protein [Flavobacterium sp.]|uniref:asparagine synthase-related protein n=1 Tax=Flavobacterium sp. TaxID=239 RepID=UPI002616F45F|nr:asparagine synthase-related protein [Flavobacterium sp.]MDD3003992.1 asparagine synthase-related protein [Flavobacterium sp.]
MIISNHIIPSKVTFVGEQKTLDLKAICVFSALGFFLDDDTYCIEQKALQPATIYKLDEQNKIVSKEAYFKWHHAPQERSLRQITEEFAALFEQILKEQSENKKVILPLSGGLDSRSQACGLHHIGANVQAYSYSFENGHNETAYSKQIAKTCGFPFQALSVPKGYLWDKVEDLAKINGCYSDFTHPRQMAFIDQYAAMGEIFSLGHWGDVLFDDMGVKDDLSFEAQVQLLFKKVVKKGGLELATELWKAWNLEGDFKDYLHERLSTLLKKINIPESANAQIRAFKSMYWAPRWTSVNLSVFESQRPIALPYYDNRMCEFICSVPEKQLAGRQIQIEYMKMRNPALAKIAWQSQKPFNLYNYHWNKKPYNLPYRIMDKAKRILSTQNYVQRNWELQFLGSENESYLQHYLFQNEKMNAIIPKSLTAEFYRKFQQENDVYYSHSVSMLLTLSLFIKSLKA